MSLYLATMWMELPINLRCFPLLGPPTMMRPEWLAIQCQTSQARCTASFLTRKCVKLLKIVAGLHIEATADQTAIDPTVKLHPVNVTRFQPVLESTIPQLMASILSVLTWHACSLVVLSIALLSPRKKVIPVRARVLLFVIPS